jgi:hypothetical protein
MPMTWNLFSVVQHLLRVRIRMILGCSVPLHPDLCMLDNSLADLLKSTLDTLLTC